MREFLKALKDLLFGRKEDIPPQPTREESEPAPLRIFKEIVRDLEKLREQRVSPWKNTVGGKRDIRGEPILKKVHGFGIYSIIYIDEKGYWKVELRGSDVELRKEVGELLLGLNLTGKFPTYIEVIYR